MGKFCGKCGSPVDAATGLCPNCDREKLNSAVEKNKVLEPSVTQKKKQKSVGASAVITVLLSVCLFITSFFAVVIWQVRNTVKEENMVELLDKVSATELVYGTGIMAEDGLEPFYGELKYRYNMDADDRSLNKFFEESTAKELIAEKIADFCEDFFKDEAELVIEKSEVVKLIKNNSSVIKEEFGVRPDESEAIIIADWVFNGNKIVLLDSSDIKNDAPVLYYLLTIGLSYGMMIVFIVLSVLIIFLMIKNSVSQATCGTGTVFTLIGVLGVLGAMLSAWIAPLWNVIWSGSAVGLLLGGFFEINAGISIILLAVGVIMLTVRSIVKNHHKKRYGK